MQLEFPFDPNPPLTEIRDRLLATYGPQRDEERHGPTSQFVKAMISSCTFDAVSQREFFKLQYSLSWDALPDTAPEVIARIISGVTYPFEKATNLVRSSNIIRAQFGRFDLSFLSDWPIDNAYAWLVRLPGVGAKIAATVLNFSQLRKPTFVVDRHVLRLCKRNNLLPAKADFKSGFNLLSRHIPPEWDADDCYELHWLIKMHAQKICRSGATDCAQCVLASICPKVQVSKGDLH